MQIYCKRPPGASVTPLIMTGRLELRPFRPEDAVEIAGSDGAVFAKGLVRVHAERSSEWMGRRSQVVVHRDDLVLVT